MTPKDIFGISNYKVAPSLQATDDLGRPPSLLTVRSTISQDFARGFSVIDKSLASFVKKQHPLALRSDLQGFPASYSSQSSLPASFLHSSAQGSELFDFADQEIRESSFGPRKPPSGSQTPYRPLERASNRAGKRGNTSMKRSRGKSANTSFEGNLNKRLRTRDE